jgi:hypothetical protein
VFLKVFKLLFEWVTLLWHWCHHNVCVDSWSPSLSHIVHINWSTGEPRLPGRAIDAFFFLDLCICSWCGPQRVCQWAADQILGMSFAGDITVIQLTRPPLLDVVHIMTWTRFGKTPLDFLAAISSSVYSHYKLFSWASDRTTITPAAYPSGDEIRRSVFSLLP